MRKLMVVLGLVSTLASAGLAQAPAGPKKSEFRVGGLMINGERSYDFGNTVRTATGSTKGVEVLARTKGVGLLVRSLSGTYGAQPQVISADARLLLAPPVFTFYLGGGLRALSSPLNTRQFAMVEAGFSSTVSIGGSGLRTYISAGGLVGKEKIKSTSGGTSSTNPAKDASPGVEGEAAVLYRVPKLPFFLSIGYRVETFNAKNSTTEAPEEVRGLRLGAGIQFGGH